MRLRPETWNSEKRSFLGRECSLSVPDGDLQHAANDAILRLARTTKLPLLLTLEQPLHHPRPPPDPVHRTGQLHWRLDALPHELFHAHDRPGVGAVEPTSRHRRGGAASVCARGGEQPPARQPGRPVHPGETLPPATRGGAGGHPGAHQRRGRAVQLHGDAPHRRVWSDAPGAGAARTVRHAPRRGAARHRAQRHRQLPALLPDAPRRVPLRAGQRHPGRSGPG